MDIKRLMEVLAAVFNMAVTPPGLRGFAPVKYPLREFSPTMNPDGSVTCTIRLWGWEYKRRHKRPEVKPIIDCMAIKRDLNEMLAPEFYVSEVYDFDTYATLKIWRLI